MSIRDIVAALPPMAVDEQVNVHHCKEGRGNDRLYIKRTRNGWVFNCFHCGESGGIMEGGAKGSLPNPSIRPSRGHDTHTDGKKLPRDVTGVWSDFSIEARVWLGRYLSIQEVKDNGILFSPSLQRVVLPVYHDGSLVGYQTRRLLDRDTYPKYLTFTSSPDDYWFHVHPHAGGGDCVVLVEDMLSAIKCSRYMSSAALFGVSIKDSLLARLVRHHSKFLIFLDYDNVQVKAAARKLKKRLDIFGECGIIDLGTDPKDCDDETLRRLLV